MKQLDIDSPPAFLAPVADFVAEAFSQPEALFWPGYFWLWNDQLDQEVIGQQLADMMTHGARSVVMLPMPHAFRPQSTNNFMAPDYLTPGFFQRVRFAVEEAARLGMNWWLYDEGGWPSGEVSGRLTAENPHLAAHNLRRERISADSSYTVPEDAFALVVESPCTEVVPPGTEWTPPTSDAVAYLYRVAVGGRADLLNPQTAHTFIQMTHQRYEQALGEHLGTTVRLAFTDEPAVSAFRPPDSIPWTPGMERLYAEQCGHDIHEDLMFLFPSPRVDMPRRAAQARITYFDLWTRRFAQAYFTPLRDWCRRHGLASSGHLGGEDETFGALHHGFGHALRQLRTLDIPGVDVIWRQVFPGRANPQLFPKLASSSAHWNGTRYAFTESFAVYGNGLTPAQMKWLVDYQFVRGINLLVGACYPLGTRDHHMTGERPHFGRCNPLWSHLDGFHAYSARLGYCLSTGTPDISVALYYPVRDMWARGEGAQAAVATYEAVAAELFARPCDFDLIDDDVLAAASITDGLLAAGAMRYAVIVCGETDWMQVEARARLRDFAAAGGMVLCLGHAPGSEGAHDSGDDAGGGSDGTAGGADGVDGGNDGAICGNEDTAGSRHRGSGSTHGTANDESAAFRVFSTPRELVDTIAPTVSLNPPARDLRVAARRVAQGRLLLLFNEGEAVYTGSISCATAHAYRLDPVGGEVETTGMTNGQVPVSLVSGESVLLLFSTVSLAASSPRLETEEVLALDEMLVAVPRQRVVAGEHDFQIQDSSETPVPFSRGSSWRHWLGEDFSGEVEYRAVFELPQAWAGEALQLEAGEVAYAATVFLDGKAVGGMAWPPWRLSLPACSGGRHELVIRVANTLANELTSKRVVDAWAARSGPGWPGVYHQRAIAFEKESRGGGLRGPVRLRRMRS